MNDSAPGMVTRIFRSLEAGEFAAADQLLPILYDELRSLGRSMMARVPPGNTLQGTAMVEQARRKAAVKHGGGQVRLDANEIDLPIDHQSEDVRTLDIGLEKLREMDPRKADVVDLRFFAGLTIEETAQVLQISEPTVERDWRFSRAFLFDQVANDD